MTGMETTHVVVAVADQYRKMDMPGTWFLPNDGYGCGYGKGPTDFPTDIQVLDEVAQQLKKRGFESGLWSSTGLPNFPEEVQGGVRIGKTDVGWIGSGYKYAFDSCRLVADGIEGNSDGRRFIWTVEGWAGTQRLAVMWTGDDYGTFDYLRWQIPTFVGCGFSSQAHISGDMDGIFWWKPRNICTGPSNEVYDDSADDYEWLGQQSGQAAMDVGRALHLHQSDVPQTQGKVDALHVYSFSGSS
jgi:hypothetical protein